MNTNASLRAYFKYLNKGAFFMSKKKKDKVKKLDDKTYGAYISALKEEKPIEEYTELNK